VPDQYRHDRGSGGAHANELCRRDAEESPIPAAPEQLQQAPLETVPDEVEQTHVARDEQPMTGSEVVPQHSITNTPSRLSIDS